MVKCAIKAVRDFSIGKEGSQEASKRILLLLSTWADQLPHVFLGDEVQEQLRELALSDNQAAGKFNFF